MSHIHCELKTHTFLRQFIIGTKERGSYSSNTLHIRKNTTPLAHQGLLLQTAALETFNDGRFKLS